MTLTDQEREDVERELEVVRQKIRDFRHPPLNPVGDRRYPLSELASEATRLEKILEDND